MIYKKVRIPVIKILAGLLVLAVLTAGTVLLLRPLQLNLSEQIVKIRDNFIRGAEESLGRRILYGSMGPSIFGTLDIRDILILREDDSVFLSIERLRLSYSLAKLLRGNFLEVFHSVRIDRPVLNLDFEKDSDLWERFTAIDINGGNASISLIDLFPDNFSFRIWNGEWEISDSVGRLRLYGVGLEANVRQNRLGFNGRWNAAISVNGGMGPAALLAGPSAGLFQAVANGRINGEYLGDFSGGRAAVSISSFYGDNFRLRPLTISFFLSGGLLEIRKTHDRSPLAVSLLYDLEENSLQGHLEAERFSLEDLITFTGPWSNYQSALGYRITGIAGFESDDSNNLNYSVNLSGFGRDDSLAASFLIMAHGNEEQLSVDTVDISFPSGRLNFQGTAGFGPFSPNGLLAFSNVRLRRGGAINGDIFISSQDRNTRVLSERFSVGNASLYSLDAAVYQEEGGLSFTFSAENASAGALFLDGAVDQRPASTRASLSLDSFFLGDILAVMEPFVPVAVPPVLRFAANDLALSTDLFFFTDYERILYNAPLLTASYRGPGNFQAAASFSGTDSRFDLSMGRISWEDENIDIIARADFSDPDDIFFSLNASQRDLNYLLEGRFQERQNLLVTGSHDLEFVLNGRPGGTYSGFARADSVPFVSGNQHAHLNFLFSLSFSSQSSWLAEIRRFEIAGLSTPVSNSAFLSFTGTARETGLIIPGIYFDDGRGALQGDINFSWDPVFSFIGFKVDISGNGNEYYGLEGMHRDESFEVSFLGQGMHLSRFSGLNAVADGSFRLFWESPESFDAEALLSSFVLHRRNETIRAYAGASANSDQFLVQGLRINNSSLELSVPFISVDRAGSKAETEATLWGILSEAPIDIFFRGDASFNASSTWLDLLRDFSSLDGSLNVNVARYDTIEFADPFSFDFSLRQQAEGLAMDLNGGPRNMLRFHYGPEAGGGANFYAALSGPSPVRGAFTGFIDSDSIDAHTTDLYVDMGALWSLLPPIDVISFPGGIVTASVRISGALEDPEFFGVAHARSLQVLVPEFVNGTIRPVPLTVLLEGSEARFGPIDAVVGQGRALASGVFRFERWIPNIFTIDVQIPQETPVPYGFNLSGVLANGQASGRLVLSMEDMIFSVGGDMTAHNTEISLDFDELAAMESGSSRQGQVSVIADIQLRSGRRVEFFWPSVEFPILQATADMGTGIHITADAALRRFTLEGDVGLRSGEIFYLERNFYIREGTLFFRENEVEFDPSISARAEIRERSDVGPVTISMIIDNAPLRSFEPRFVSSPALSLLEIYSLLGHAPMGEPGEDQRNIAASVALDYLAQGIVVRRFQRQVRDFLGLDMFSMRTQLLQNVIFQAMPWGQPGMEGNNQIGNYFDNTTVFIGRYFAAEIFGEAMLSLRHDENRLNWGGIVLEPEIGLEMRSPLFDIRLSMIPQHPENWFIDDVSLSLIWRRSF